MRRKTAQSPATGARELHDPDLRLALAQRVRSLREQRGLTQQQVADYLDVVRSAVSEIETAKRDISAVELSRYSHLFGETTERLLATTAPAAEARHLMLRSEELDAAGRVALERFVELGHEYQALEESLGAQRSADVRVVEKPVARLEDAELLADQERRRLDLGVTPARQLVAVLEEDVSIKVLALDMAEGLSGACLRSDRFGPAILLNRRHVPGRQVFTLAHEYFHLLTEGRIVGAAGDAAHVYESRRPGAKKDPADLYADQFAGHLLLPTEHFRESLRRLRRDDGTLNTPDLVGLARYFGVSVLAVFVRMNVLGYVPWEAADAAYDDPALQDEILRVGGERPPEPLRFKRLAVRACLDGLITKERLGELLAISRGEVEREIRRHGGGARQTIRVRL